MPMIQVRGNRLVRGNLDTIFKTRKGLTRRFSSERQRRNRRSVTKLAISEGRPFKKVKIPAAGGKTGANSGEFHTERRSKNLNFNSEPKVICTGESRQKNHKKESSKVKSCPPGKTTKKKTFGMPRWRDPPVRGPSRGWAD